MKKKFSLALMAAGMLLMTASCSEETSVEITPPTSVDNGEGTIRLALGGAVSKTTKTRAEGDAITAEDDEKELKTLYAVIFKDEENADEDNLLLFKAVNITDSIDLATKYTDERKDSIRFKVSTGDYKICFVGNPDEDLAGEIEGLTAGSSTAKNFKDIVATQLPSRKPMLMTSTFYDATIKTNEDTKLETVTLERAMARVDIVNKADGITIDSVKLVNRTVQSILISDNPADALNEAYLEKDTTYKVNLAGSLSTPTKCEAKIYSYEQYGTDDNAPSMEVYYSIGEKNYKHTIDFKDGDENQINLKRNYLYTVNITNNAGKLTFTLTVADWNQGTVFEVTSDELWDNLDVIDYSETSVGQIMLSDGTIVEAKEVAASTDLQSQAIGVVVYRYPDGDTRTNKAGSHGLVLSLKKSATSIAWRNSNTAFGTAYSTLKNAYENGSDGLTLTDAIINSTTTTLSTFPAFNAVKTYRESTPAPTNHTTDWYIPSIGEWIDILGTDGLGGVDVSSVKSDNTERSNSSPMILNSPAADNAAKAINNVMTTAKVSYDTFGGVCWSSTERADGTAYGVYFGGSLYFNIYSKNATDNNRSVRYILAF